MMRNTLLDYGFIPPDQATEGSCPFIFPRRSISILPGANGFTGANGRDICHLQMLW
jgi:hypothetical protein